MRRGSTSAGCSPNPTYLRARASDPGDEPPAQHAQFGQMKKTAILINTSRGPVVDEAALVEALKAKKIAGAGLDVYEREPAVHPGLISNPSVVLAPHIARATVHPPEMSPWPRATWRRPFVVGGRRTSSIPRPRDSARTRYAWWPSTSTHDPRHEVEARPEGR